MQAGNWDQAMRLYRDAFTLERHSGGPQQKMSDAAASGGVPNLLAGPRDTAAWRALHDYANSALPRPGNGLADLHVILAQAVMGDEPGSMPVLDQMHELAREGRYPSGSYLPALARGFAAFEGGDFPGDRAFAPLAGQNERIGGSRAQHDLIEFTLLKAYLNADGWRTRGVCSAGGGWVLPASPSQDLRRWTDRPGSHSPRDLCAVMKCPPSPTFAV